MQSKKTVSFKLSERDVATIENVPAEKCGRWYYECNRTKKLEYIIEFYRKNGGAQIVE